MSKGAVRAIAAAKPVTSYSGAIELIGTSPTIARIQELVRRAAPLDTPLLLVAEAGIDAESVARDLHVRRRGPHAPWASVNCAVEGAQLDARLFGGASAHDSDFEVASSSSLLARVRGGSLFLSDVAELPSSVQSRLVRVMRDGEFRVDDALVRADFRVIASALPSIDGDLHDRRFRLDLFRRLSATRIDLPPLRDRAADLPTFVERVAQECCAGSAVGPKTFTQAAVALLSALTWPGNLAELREAVEQILLKAVESPIPVEQVLPSLQLERALKPFIPAGNLREARMRFERDYISAVLQHHEWRMSDAAAALGIQRPNLYRKARQLGIPVARTTE